MLIGSDFTRANLANANMRGAIVKSTHVMNVRGEPTGRLQKTVFDGANLACAELTGLDLTQCSVEGTRFE